MGMQQMMMIADGKDNLDLLGRFDSFDNRLNQIAEREYNKTLDKLLGQRMITPLRGKYAW